MTSDNPDERPAAVDAAGAEASGTPVCGRCGSENVMRDAWARWSNTAQDWELGAVFDQAHCDDCEDELNAYS